MRINYVPSSETTLDFDWLFLFLTINFTMLKLHLQVFVELDGGVGDVPGWRRDGAYVELGFR